MVHFRAIATTEQLQETPRWKSNPHISRPPEVVETASKLQKHSPGGSIIKLPSAGHTVSVWDNLLITERHNSEY